MDGPFNYSFAQTRLAQHALELESIGKSPWYSSDAAMRLFSSGACIVCIAIVQPEHDHTVGWIDAKWAHTTSLNLMRKSREPG